MRAEMEIDKLTQNAVRYAETPDSPASGSIGTLYISKLGLRMLFGVDGDKFPRSISVEVMLADETNNNKEEESHE